jgi:hypothetical protein
VNVDMATDVYGHRPGILGIEDRHKALTEDFIMGDKDDICAVYYGDVDRIQDWFSHMQSLIENIEIVKHGPLMII